MTYPSRDEDSLQSIDPSSNNNDDNSGETSTVGAPHIEEVIDIAAKETCDIVWMKTLVFFVFVLVSLITSIVVAVLSSNVEATRFEDDFMQDAEQLINHMSRIGLRHHDTMSSMSSFFMAGGAAATAAAAQQTQRQTQQQQASQQASLLDSSSSSSNSNSSSAATSAAAANAAANAAAWPYVTIPNVELQGQHVRSILNVSAVFLAPLVRRDQLHDWNMYSAAHEDWIQKGLLLEEQEQEMGGMGNHPNNSTAAATAEVDMNSNLHINFRTQPPITPYIFRLDGKEKVSEEFSSSLYYFPIWQSSPPRSSWVNLNIGSVEMVQQALDQVVQEKASVITQVVVAVSATTSTPATGTTTTTAASNATTTSIIDDNEQVVGMLAEPTSLFLWPVFDDFTINYKYRTVVGVAVAPIPWSEYLRNIFPSQTLGIHVVLENTCGQVYTYEVNERDVTFVGAGDHHMSYFDGHVKTITYIEMMRQLKSSSSAASSSHTMLGVPFSTQYECQFQVSIYPNAVYLANHSTSTAAVYSGTILVLFTFSFFVILFYSGYIEERYHSLRHKAAHTAQLVNALFPKKVQERMFKELETKQKEDDIGGGGGGSGNGAGGDEDDQMIQIKTFLRETKADKDKDNLPIADLFPNCTVMFADIAGFTAWSSDREPVQVFQLLETLYKAFDEIAERRRIFKVETIGDCYMCVTGLPDPRKDHAVAMSRFARDCLNKVHHLTKNLVDLLGPETANLSLRIGLHSGPVTAGVLRGDKSRFQLFGDTVNTASRMESTGQKDCIQLSDTTAEELNKVGKGHWFTPREGGVEAKGKGFMQTYWLKLEVMSSSGGSRSSLSGRSASNSSSNCDDSDHDVTAAEEPSSREKEEATGVLLQKQLQEFDRLTRKSLTKATMPILANGGACSSSNSNNTNKVTFQGENGNTTMTPWTRVPCLLPECALDEDEDLEYRVKRRLTGSTTRLEF